MAKIKRERMIGITDAMDTALLLVEDFTGLKPSAYCRVAILERLVKDGFMQHPGASRLQNIPQREAAE
jgi:hypothetical protein